MIVSDDTVSKALAYLAEDPHPIALAQKALTDAENEKDRLYAIAYSEADQGSIRDREMACERRATVIDARKRIAVALSDTARHKARVKAAEMICEIWRTEQANIRAAEKIR